MYRILGISGTRPFRLSASQITLAQGRLIEGIRSFKAQGGEVVITGGALGVDTWAAFAALNEGLQLITYVPFPQQADDWTPAERRKYQEMLDASKEVRVFGETPDNRLYFARNHAIVDDSDITLAITTSRSGRSGSIATAQYALSRGKPLIWVTVAKSGLAESFHPAIEPQPTLFD